MTTNTPATSTRSTKSSTSKPKATSTKPAARATTKSTAKSTSKPAAVKATKTSPKRAAKSAPGAIVESERHPVAPTMTPEDVTNLGVLHDTMTAAVEAFEIEVVSLIKGGASPTHVGKIVGMGNSSVRRICMRRSPGLVK